MDERLRRPIWQTSGSSLLLDVGVPFRAIDQDFFVEAQAHNGLLRWLDNFDAVTICAPIVPQRLMDRSMQWTRIDDLLAGGRLRVSPLPWGYDLRAHMTHIGAIRQTMRSLISSHTYLCFSNLGWLGAWGSVGADEAHHLGRFYAVWLDWVLHEMPVRREGSVIRRGWRQFQRLMTKRNSLRAIGRAELGLFNGKTVHDAYAKGCRNPKVVHDIHLTKADVISDDSLRNRLMRDTGLIKIIYVGRTHEMKGPWHWLDAMQKIVASDELGRRVRASWIGGGELLASLRSEVEQRGLADDVSFFGNETDRGKLLNLLRDADIFVFCHLTPESPRCLIEALMSGLPIVGFDSAYARDLITGAPAGEFVPIGDVAALVAAVVACLCNPTKLRTMSEAAYAVGRNFSDTAVFKHRSDLIKEFL